MMRTETSLSSPEGYSRSAREATASIRGMKRSVSKLLRFPCRTAAIRSSPMPVSIEGAGSGRSAPASSRSNSMKTRFQSSRKRSLPASMRASGRPGSDVRAEVVVELRARPAGARVAHGPEIVLLPEAEDPAGRDPDVVGPDPVGLVVLRVDRRVEPVRRQAENAGDELPGEADRLALEIVAEREVAEHLEEGVVLGRPADVLEVVVLPADPHALLAGRGPPVAPLLEAEEDVLELVHAGVREQDGRVVLGEERRARDDLVAARREELEEGLADLGRSHLGSSSEPPSTRSTLPMPFSISSVAMSRVDWMPMTRSLKLSGLDEYFMPCSKEM